MCMRHVGLTVVDGVGLGMVMQEIWGYALLFVWKELKVRKIKDNIELQKAERRKVRVQDSKLYELVSRGRLQWH